MAVKDLLVSKKAELHLALHLGEVIAIDASMLAVKPLLLLARECKCHLWSIAWNTVCVWVVCCKTIPLNNIF